jgi:hypothetical protein
MAHEEFDLSELLDALRAGGDIDIIRRSVEMVLQALIDTRTDRHHRRRSARAGREPHEPAQRQPSTAAVHEGR